MVHPSFFSFVLCISRVQHQVCWFFSLWTLLYCQPKVKQINLSFCYKNTNKGSWTEDDEIGSTLTGGHRVRFWTTHVRNSICEIWGWFFWLSFPKKPIHFVAKDVFSFPGLLTSKLLYSPLFSAFPSWNIAMPSITWSYPKYSCNNNDVMLSFWPWRTGRNKLALTHLSCLCS